MCLYSWRLSDVTRHRHCPVRHGIVLPFGGLGRERWLCCRLPGGVCAGRLVVGKWAIAQGVTLPKHKQSHGEQDDAYAVNAE